MDHPTYFTKAVEALKELPVAGLVPEILASVAQKKVTIVTAETGSGKTLLANAALADASDHPVWVLVPRRFLAMDAAKNIAELSGLQLGSEVGYAVGRKTTDRSKFSAGSKLIFATYGYALSSGLLDDPNTKTVVCDEVHEAGIDTSLARAIIHRRLKEKNDLRVVEMSATIDADRQAEYWKDVAPTAIHSAQGKCFACDYRHMQKDDISFLLAARDLLREVEKTEYKNVADDNREKGIAVFIEGVKVAEGVADQLRRLCKESNMPNVEVATIYADMDEAQRKKALAAPAAGHLKILVGTPVIESGMNIKWLRAGISNGLGKVPYYRHANGAEALVTEELPQWRLTQQEGRVKRFDKGIFILHAANRKEDREVENTPEISRISLDGLVMYAANYGIDPTGLKFDAGVPLWKLEDAKKNLMRLQLLNDDWTLTEQGRFVIGLPLRPEAGAMMWAAKERFPAVLHDAIILAAVAEVGGMVELIKPKDPLEEMAQDEEPRGRRQKKDKGVGLRGDMRIGHGEDQNSDVLDAFKAYKKVAARIGGDLEELCGEHRVALEDYRKLARLGREPQEAECAAAHLTLEAFQRMVEQERESIERRCADMNMSVMRYKEVRELIVDLHRRMDKEAPVKTQAATDEQLVQILLHGSVNHIFERYKDGDNYRYGDLLRKQGGYKEDKFTVTGAAHEPFAVAHLREVSRVDAEPMVLATNITRVSKEALCEFLAGRPELLANKKVEYRKGNHYVTGNYLEGAEIEFRIPKKPNRYVNALLGDLAVKAKPSGKSNSQAVDDTPELEALPQYGHFARGGR